MTVHFTYPECECVRVHSCHLVKSPSNKKQKQKQKNENQKQKQSISPVLITLSPHCPHPVPTLSSSLYPHPVPTLSSSLYPHTVPTHHRPHRECECRARRGAEGAAEGVWGHPRPRGAAEDWGWKDITDDGNDVCGCVDVGVNRWMGKT